MNKFNYKNLSPFKWFVLQNFPFIEADFDAITNWQLFCKLGEEMNKIIEKVNQAGVQTENLTNAFIDLQNYVNNYFENLDIQEEVNNKLDEMSQSGELTEIIAQYLQLAGLLCFNTVAELKNATNLINGSFVKTMGENSYNDGNGYFYKIRTLLNTDTIDEKNIIALTNFNTLIAERLSNNTIGDKTNPIFYGADPTGINDSSIAINKCIQANLGKSIVFTPGKYKVDSPINTPYYVDEQVNINFNGSTIFSNKNLDYVIGIGTYNKGSDMPNKNNYSSKCCYSIIENFVIDAPNSQIGILTEQNYWYPRIINGSIFNTIIGIQAGRQKNVLWSSDLFVDNVYIQCKSYKNTNTRGIIINGHDNKIVNCRIYNAFIGIENNKGGNCFINDQIYLYGHLNEKNSDEFKNIYPQTIAVLENGNDNKYDNFYTDSYSTHFKITTGGYQGQFTNCRCFTNVSGFDDIAFDNSTGTIQAITINNCTFNLGQAGENGNIGFKTNINQRLDLISQLCNLRNNFSYYIDKDLLLIDMNRNWASPYTGSKQFLSGKYYIIGYIPASKGHSYTVEITNIGTPNKHEGRFYVNGNYQLSELNNQGVAGTAFGLGGKLVTLRDGKKYIEVSIMRQNTNAATLGIQYKLELDGYGVGFIPVLARHLLPNNPEPIETTPDITTTFGF